MAKKRVADVLVDTLVAAGVKHAYGLIGDSLNSITDSIRPQKELQWIPSGTRKRQRLRRSRRAVLPDA